MSSYTEGSRVNPEILASESFYKAILDAIPLPVFLVGDDWVIHDCNRATGKFLTTDGSLLLRRRGGEALQCLHARETPGGCGHSSSCPTCIIRNSIKEAIQGHEVVRRRAKLETVANGQVCPIFLLVTAAPFLHADRQLVLLILEDISELVELKRLLPICSYCKKIRTDQEFWLNVDRYFEAHMDVNFTHSICPECMTMHYPDAET